MARTFEFLIDGVVTGESGLIRVIGRCCDEPIRVGDHFRSVCAIEGFDENKLPFATHAVNLQVVSIQAYGQSIDALGPGMTGSLALIGEGAQWVLPNFAIGSGCCPMSSAESETPSITAQQ